MSASGPTWADGNPLFDLGDINVAWTASAGIGSFGVSQANFGAESYDADQAASSRRTSPIWGEAFVKPGLNFSTAILGGQLYANISAVYAQTIGDGDASLSTAMRGNPGEVGLEEANFGFTGDLSFVETGTFDLQLGRQNLVIDDGFLIADGTINAGKRANYFLAPRNVFDGLGVLHLNGTPLRADLFVLKDDTRPALARRGFDQPPTDFTGFDITWFENVALETADGGKTYADRKRYVTAMYFHVTKSVLDGVKTSRDGMDVYSLSAGGALLPNLSDFSFYTQAVIERNPSAVRPVRANAYYIEPGWTFSDMKLTPNMSYRYSHFSGDRDPKSLTDQTYDPLFYGGGYRGNFGSYYYGEILSEYFIANSNIDIHQITLTLAMPFHVLNDMDTLKLDFLYYRYFYDQKGAVGLKSNSLGQEFDVAAEYQYSPQTSFSAAVGVATPGSGAKESVAQQLDLPSGQGGQFNRATGIAEIFANFSF